MAGEAVFPDGRQFRDSRGVVQLTRAEWERRYKAAVDLMERRAGTPKALIEIAAQHPLIDGELPNAEFSRRLELGAELYRKLTAEGRAVEIYVPGSRHVFAGIADNTSLSEAGRRFLLERGIPAEAIHGDDLNRRCKGEAGVYNSADECFVAAWYFKEGGFGTLHSVVSPVQLMRKTLHYIWFGVLPLNHSAPLPNTYHDYLREALDAVPHVLGVDPSQQGDDSAWGRESRRARRPPVH